LRMFEKIINNRWTNTNFVEIRKACYPHSVGISNIGHSANLREIAAVESDYVGLCSAKNKKSLEIKN